MNKTILFVEDDEDDREFLLDAVKNVNPSVNVIFALNGMEALNCLQQRKTQLQLPCLVVLDINMPLLDGKETYKKIKEDLQLGSVPIVVFTSSQNPNDKALFNQLGVEFISKPYDFSYMNEIVSHMISICS